MPLFFVVGLAAVAYGLFALHAQASAEGSVPAYSFTAIPTVQGAVFSLSGDLAAKLQSIGASVFAPPQAAVKTVENPDGSQMRVTVLQGVVSWPGHANAPPPALVGYVFQEWEESGNPSNQFG